MYTAFKSFNTRFAHNLKKPTKRRASPKLFTNLHLFIHSYFIHICKNTQNYCFLLGFERKSKAAYQKNRWWYFNITKPNESPLLYNFADLYLHYYLRKLACSNTLNLWCGKNYLILISVNFPLNLFVKFYSIDPSSQSYKLIGR